MNKLTDSSTAAAALAGFKGVGPWTVAMVAIRGAGEPDVFPPKDMGLERAWDSISGTRGELIRQSEHWAPWRSYAASLLWRSLSQLRSLSHE